MLEIGFHDIGLSFSNQSYIIESNSNDTFTMEKAKYIEIIDVWNTRVASSHMSPTVHHSVYYKLTGTDHYQFSLTVQ